MVCTCSVPISTRHGATPRSNRARSISTRSAGRYAVSTPSRRISRCGSGYEACAACTTRCSTASTTNARYAPFADLEDFVRRTGATVDQVEALATAGAFEQCFGQSRRSALWAAGAVGTARPNVRRDGTVVETLPGVVTGTGAPALPGMTEMETVHADLWAMGISTGKHPTEFVRDELHRQGVVTAADLRALPDRTVVEVAGIVTHRQQPATSKGTVFLNLEDETGLINVICAKGVWKRFRTVARGRARATRARGTREASRGDQRGRWAHHPLADQPRRVLTVARLPLAPVDTPRRLVLATSVHPAPSANNAIHHTPLSFPVNGSDPLVGDDGFDARSAGIIEPRGPEPGCVDDVEPWTPAGTVDVVEVDVAGADIDGADVAGADVAVTPATDVEVAGVWIVSGNVPVVVVCGTVVDVVVVDVVLAVVLVLVLVDKVLVDDVLEELLVLLLDDDVVVAFSARAEHLRVERAHLALELRIEAREERS